jgi:hypothetical protein
MKYILVGSRSTIFTLGEYLLLAPPQFPASHVTTRCEINEVWPVTLRSTHGVDEKYKYSVSGSATFMWSARKMIKSKMKYKTMGVGSICNNIGKYNTMQEGSICNNIRKYKMLSFESAAFTWNARKKW